MPDLAAQQEHVMARMIEHGGTESWDWDADLAFAEYLGDDESVKMIRAAKRSAAPFPFIKSAWRLTWRKTITNNRLRILRSLVKQGKVIAYWQGTGYGGTVDFGVGRVRSYRLRKEA
jgi:hypothetical protein